MSKYEPALYVPKRPSRLAGIGIAVYWRPTVPWMVFTAVLAVLAMMRVMRKSEFLYWQF
jgi:hypothetical protein